jgi:hypothetical protein
MPIAASVKHRRLGMRDRDPLRAAWYSARAGRGAPRGRALLLARRFETSLDELVDALDLPKRAAHALASQGEADGPSRRFHTDGHHLVFTTSCYIDASGGSGGAQRMHPLEIRVLVSGEFLLTIHDEPVSLTKQLAPDIAEGRSEAVRGLLGP